MKTIALCINATEPNYADPQLHKTAPGSGWIKHFLGMMTDHEDCVVLHGEAVVSSMKWSVYHPKDIYVVQEELNPYASDLLRYGANPSVVFCAESPIYAPNFYDQLPKLKTLFKRQFTFWDGSDQLYFPSYDQSWIKDLVPWDERKPLVMVSSNKHYSAIQGVTSPSYDLAIKSQLQDFRYGAIDYFKGHGLDLFGRGWPQDVGQECDDKLETTKGYKFSLCIENGAYDGYVTEKIIDCFVAGVIPVYLGASDITEHVDSRAFIDFRMFTHFDEARRFMEGLDEEMAMDYIEAGREFLLSATGMKFSNYSFAHSLHEALQLDA